MIVLKRLSVWLALAGVGFAAWVLIGANQKDPMPQPISEPPRSPYQQTVAASGIIEAVNENVRIAPPVAGLIIKMFVTVGDQVDEQAPLFQLDDRDLRAQLLTRGAAIPPIRAQIDEQQYRIGDLDTQFRRLKSVHDERAVSEDDVKRTWYALEMAKRSSQRLDANLKQAVAQRDEVSLLLERLTVRAPRRGTILQVNVRAGEYATLNPAEPLILLGETEQLQVRADVDEVNAPLVTPDARGVASIRSMGGQKIPLRFVRIEPFVVPKKSLTGDNTERVDTRVLQIIYRFDRPSFPVYAGQQVDVFIDRQAASLSNREQPSTLRTGEDRS
ncbi:MAG: efflux RND transporter periplasmic adaptor subunit [Nitrospira sp.]|nr:efflux RND transporter periplasmic adaptor subunit [Nitrospira sp.]MDH4370173.1 efflux RND transporter periplasmic adaptor subunit [Nitrospira sp.]MDH5346896.1 efflux RND transporter periplasmic adaptor subunit [Nitrospira sp.]MDH5497248.1 efflux RND transporter periplasmic adaptor subunit [Nitrospira sp.]MDH5723936.1 efflux RND transporter periplasmic adaptor subunit [Nitrospira sp.]